MQTFKEFLNENSKNYVVTNVGVKSGIAHAIEDNHPDITQKWIEDNKSKPFMRGSVKIGGPRGIVLKMIDYAISKAGKFTELEEYGRKLESEFHKLGRDLESFYHYSFDPSYSHDKTVIFTHTDPYGNKVLLRVFFKDN